MADSAAPPPGASDGPISGTDRSAAVLPLRGDLTLAHGITIAIGVLLCGSSLLGLLTGGKDWYAPNPFARTALLAQDAVTLVLGLPFLIVSVWRARRGSVRGLLCWLGALLYFAYSYYFYVVGVPVNAFFLGYIAIVSLGVYGALTLLFAIDPDATAACLVRLPVRLTSAYLVGTALFFASLWVAIAFSFAAAHRPMGGVTRAIISVDGVFLLPLFFYGGVALWRHRPLGYTLAIPLLVKSTATFLTLITSTLTRVWWGRPLEGAGIGMYAVGCLCSALLLIAGLRRVTSVPPPAS